MVDRQAETLRPPAPERDLDEEHKQLVVQLADHPDPKVRILAHISTRQFELSERLSAMQKVVDEGFAAMKEGFRDLKDRVNALDNGFTDVEERTSALEGIHSLNGSSSPTQ